MHQASKRTDIYGGGVRFRAFRAPPPVENFTFVPRNIFETDNENMARKVLGADHLIFKGGGGGGGLEDFRKNSCKAIAVKEKH